MCSGLVFLLLARLRHTDYCFIRFRDDWVVKQQKTHVLVKRQE